MNISMDIDHNSVPHEPPRYYGYWAHRPGGFSRITQCMQCGNVGLSEDCSTLNCCYHCGGNVVDAGVAKWIKPTYSGFLWWRKMKTTGYWSRE